MYIAWVGTKGSMGSRHGHLSQSSDLDTPKSKRFHPDRERNGSLANDENMHNDLPFEARSHDWYSSTS